MILGASAGGYAAEREGADRVVPDQLRLESIDSFFDGGCGAERRSAQSDGLI
jgi:hypothetical protein